MDTIKTFEKWFVDLTEIEQQKLLTHIFNKYMRSEEGYNAEPFPNSMINTATISIGQNICQSCGRPL